MASDNESKSQYYEKVRPIICDISADQREILNELLNVGTEAHVALIAQDPELAERIRGAIGCVKQLFGVEA